MTITDDITLTRTERLTIAAERRRERVRRHLAAEAQGIAGDGLELLHDGLDDEGWDALDLAVRSVSPVGELSEGEFDSGIAGQDLDRAVMG